MHYLHRILVYIPNACPNREETNREELLEAIRSFAENATENAYGQAYDWRDTESACLGNNYSGNVFLAEDAPEQFLQELIFCRNNMLAEIQFCIEQLKNSVGTDLEEIIKKEWNRESREASTDGHTFMTTYYLHCIAAHLLGEYRCDSRFYNTDDYTARLYPEDIESVRENPRDWALVLFDYRY